MTKAAAAVLPAELFGHPRGLAVLTAAYMWERLAFWGMQGILLLYMTKYLLLPEHARDVVGLAAYRSGLEAVTGNLSDVAFAAQTYGIFSGLVYLTPVTGAWLGDRLLGRTKTIIFGCLLTAAGHFALASNALFLGGLALLIMGCGCLLGNNMAAQIGLLYAAEDQRRIRAFGAYVVASNIGALTAPLIIGTLGEQVDWRWGFGVAGAAVLIGLGFYLAGLRDLPRDTMLRDNPQTTRARLSRAEWQRIGVIGLLLFGPFVLYTIAFQQAYALMYVWADTHVDRVVLGYEVPVTWIGIFDGLMTIVGVWLGIRVMLFLQRKGRTIGDVSMLGFGLAGLALAWVLAAAIAQMPMTPLLWWLAFFVVLDFSVGGFVEPQVLAIVSRDSPQSVLSTMMSLQKVAVAIGYFILGWLGRFYEPLGASGFWLLNAAIVATGAVIVLGAHGWWVRRLGPVEQQLGVGPTSM